MIFVTVGTNEARFDRLLQAFQPSPPDEELLVQHGPSGVRPPGATCVDYLPYDELVATVRRARVVVTHAGVGSIMTALANGKRPIVVPRLRRFDEAVDDHQLQLAVPPGRGGPRHTRRASRGSPCGARHDGERHRCGRAQARPPPRYRAARVREATLARSAAQQRLLTRRRLRTAPLFRLLSAGAACSPRASPVVDRFRAARARSARRRGGVRPDARRVGCRGRRG